MHGWPPILGPWMELDHVDQIIGRAILRRVVDMTADQRRVDAQNLAAMVANAVGRVFGG